MCRMPLLEIQSSFLSLYTDYMYCTVYITVKLDFYRVYKFMKYLKCSEHLQYVHIFDGLLLKYIEFSDLF